jgi:hypothetical protein
MLNIGWADDSPVKKPFLWHSSMCAQVRRTDAVIKVGKLEISIIIAVYLFFLTLREDVLL